MVFGYLVNIAWVIVLLMLAAILVFGIMANGFNSIVRYFKAKRLGVPTFCPCLDEGKMSNICQRGGKMCKQVCDCPDGNWGPCDGKGWCGIKDEPTEDEWWEGIR